MRLLLVPSLDIAGGNLRRYVPYGLLSLQAIASDFDTEVDVLGPWSAEASNCIGSLDELISLLFRDVDLTTYDVVGFSTVTSSFLYTLRLSEFVRKRHPGARIVYGGPFVTKLAPQILSEFPLVDAIFVGEAEHSFATFLERCDAGTIDFSDIPGVAIRGGRFTPAVTTDDLDDLPSILRARGFGEWFRWRSPAPRDDTPIPLEATRGCPLQCSFCSTRQVWGARVRRKSARRLVEEMTELSALCGGSRFFNLIGDNIGVPRAPFLEFCDELAAINPGFTWGCSLKVDRLEESHLRRMWAAGMRAMFVGLESGNQETLDKVRKKTDIEKEIANIRSAVDLGYRVTTSFIIGFPWEEQDDVTATYRLHCELLKDGVETSQINILSPIPGTDIVADGTVLFEPSWLELTSDGVITAEEMAEAATEHPQLFSHFGRYDTPHLEKDRLISVRHAADMYSRMSRQQTSEDWNAF